METYEAEHDPRMRYNMLLEFSSYLRQGAANADRREANVPDDMYSPKSHRPRHGYDDSEENLCWEITRVLLIVATIMAFVIALAQYLSGAFESNSERAASEPVDSLYGEGD